MQAEDSGDKIYSVRAIRAITGLKKLQKRRELEASVSILLCVLSDVELEELRANLKGGRDGE